MLSRIVVILAIAASTVLAGNHFIPSLPEEILADLARRDPSEYQTYRLRNENITSNLTKRGPPSGLTGIQTKCRADSCFDFTFDDGPYKNMRSITDKAVAGGFKVTFFVNVKNYDCAYDEPYASSLKYAYSKGMQICSHTATHPHLNTLTHAQIDKEITAVETMLYKVIGAVPACIRPPYGEANQDVVDYLNNRHGYVVVNWNYDTQDADGAAEGYGEKVVKSIKAPRKAIVLMHETIDSTAKKLFPKSIKIAKSNGYTADDFMTVPDSLEFNGYKLVTTPGKRDKTWNCRGL